MPGDLHKSRMEIHKSLEAFENMIHKLLVMICCLAVRKATEGGRRVETVRTEFPAEASLLA